jgi:hypothetical protein
MEGSMELYYSAKSDRNINETNAITNSLLVGVLRLVQALCCLDRGCKKESCQLTFLTVDHNSFPCHPSRLAFILYVLFPGVFNDAV